MGSGSATRTARHRDPLATPRRLHATAVHAGQNGHAARAIALHQRALSALERAGPTEGGARLRAEIWLARAVAEADVHGLAAGLAAIERAERLAGELGDPALTVRLHSNHAFIASRGGRLDLAMTQLDLAAGMISAATAHDRFAILLNGGNLRLHRGDLPAARRHLSRAAQAAALDGLADGQFKALHNLGYVEFLAGNLPGALARMSEAAEIRTDVSRGIWALDRGRILLEAGLLSEADDAFAQAAHIFAADRLAQDLGEAELARAECALVAGDAAAARRFAARARTRFRRRGNVRWQQVAETVLLQGDLADGRPGLRLAPVAQRLAGALHDDPARARVAELVAAEALLAGNRLDAAAEVLHRLRSGAAAGIHEPVPARVHRRYVEARVALAGADRAGARRHIRAGLDALAAYQRSFGCIDLRTAGAVHGHRLGELDISMALQDGRPLDVLAAAERSRAVSSRVPPIQPPADGRSAELLAELRGIVEALRADGRDPSALQQRRSTLERAIRARSWAVAGSTGAPPPIAAPTIRAAVVAADVTMAAYVHVDGLLHAVVLSPTTVQLVPLGPYALIEAGVRRARADFDMLAARRLPAGIRASVQASLHRSLRALDEALLGQAALADVGRLVVVPTGVLGALAWSALPSRRARPTVVAPSATAWTTAGPPAAARGPVDVGVCAGPGLARAGEEMAAVARCWPAAASTVATRHAVLTALAHNDIAHLAVHGSHRGQSPLFSCVQLEDGPLFAWEIGLSAPHVVLSACEVGLATIRPGDEALGLTSVLLGTGTRCVVSSVAKVGDDDAAAAMAEYHLLLSAGRPSDEALAGAVAAADRPLPLGCFGAAWCR